MIGQVISHYRIVEKLGEGGMGVVYKAEDLKLGRAVALKFLPSHLLESEEHKARFLHEARAAALLDHPNICTVYEIDEADGKTFLAMACLEGQTLKQKIAARPLPLEEALDIALQIGQGLQAAHEKGVVHRDIKPANILITPQGQVRIMDFGLAQLSDRTKLTATGTKLGTPAYMSPEQTAGKSTDRRTDIWSFGVVLYEMVSGQLPFQGESEQAVAYGIVHTEPEPLTALRSGVPKDLDSVIAKALAKDLTERYQHVEDMLVDLRVARKRWEQGRLRSAAPAQGARRSRVALAALLVVIAAFAGWWGLRQSQRATNPLAGARFTRLTDFEGMEIEAAISPDGKFVAFLSDREGVFDLWVTQIGSGEFRNLTQGQFPDLPHETMRSIGFSADGAHLWLRAEGGKLLPTMGGLARPFGPQGLDPRWSPDGKKILYFAPPENDALVIAEANFSNPRQILRGDFKAGIHQHFPTWSPDSRFAYCVRGVPPDQVDIWRVPAEGGDAEQITRHDSRLTFPTLLDNRTLLYTATAEDGSGPWMYVMDLEDRSPQRATIGVEKYSSVAASADGRRLAVSVANPTGSLWTVPISDEIAAEAAVSRYQVPTSRAIAPRLASDVLYYLSSRAGADGLWKAKEGQAVELWKGADGVVTEAPAVSPDGSTLCFSFRKGGRSHLYLMNTEGANIRSLAPSLDVEGSASWSPDGQWIAVSADAGDGVRLFKVPVDGGAPVTLSDIRTNDPLWSPDGRLIVYEQATAGSSRMVGAVTPEGEPAPLPFEKIVIRAGGDRYRFLPDGKSIVLLLGDFRRQNFWLLDLESTQLRQLTNLRSGFSTRGFDITPDGKQILFDRVQENSDIVLIDLARE